MRIRKTLAKALGQMRPSESTPCETWILSSSPDTFVDEPPGLFCQLNQSPWDVYPNHRFVRSAFKCFEGVKSLPNSEKEPEEISYETSKHGKDVLGKVPALETIEEKPLINKRVTGQKKSRKKVNTVKKGKDEIVMCKKNDGRKWFCKNPAMLPHPLCEHHLTLSRSYKGHVPSGSGIGHKTKDEKPIKDFNSDYYYYGTVAPSEGRRRSARNVKNVSNTMHVNVKMEKDALDGDCEGDEVMNHKAVSGSNSKETVETGAKKARKSAKYRSMDSFSGDRT